MAQRRSAHWCSDACRVRAWRGAREQSETRDSASEIARLETEISMLRAALAAVEQPSADTRFEPPLPPRACDEELARLREENAILRAWVTDRAKESDKAGAGGC